MKRGKKIKLTHYPPALPVDIAPPVCYQLGMSIKDSSATFRPRPIEDIAADVGIPARCVIPYGRHIAKIDRRLLGELDERPGGRLVVMTAMNPAPAGVGKTTLTIGLTQSLRLLGAKAIACIRQPSLGPFFGAKGGATGSGLSEVFPADDIALHFTGDDHAVATAHNLIAALLDNHVYHGNALGIDTGRIFWRRVSSLSDRVLRRVRIGVGDERIERLEEFHVSAVSEIMTIICLSRTLEEMKERISRILLALDKDGRPVTVGALEAAGAAGALLRNALHPNLVQSVEGAPVFVHGTPFGNLSIGCSSLMATQMALKLADYCVTESGFSTELGAEKFFDIKCRIGGLRPSATVITANLRGLRLHGGAQDLNRPDTPASIKGLANLRKHCENIERFGLPFIVALNRFADDPDDELAAVIGVLEGSGVPVFVVDVRERGGRGGVEVAAAIIKLCKGEDRFKLLYPDGMPLAEKINIIATEMYGADGVVFTEAAQKDMSEIERLGYGGLPVCMAKTPRSLSDNPSLIGRPSGFKVTVKRISPAVGAGFVIAVSAGVLLMPGMPARPLTAVMDVDEDGRITGI